MGRLLVDQVVRAPGPWFGRIAAGYLETEYAGVDAEMAVPLFDGRILAGTGGSYVRNVITSYSIHYTKLYDKYRLGAAGQFQTTYRKGGTLLLGLEGYPLNTVSTSYNFV